MVTMILPFLENVLVKLVFKLIRVENPWFRV